MARLKSGILGPMTGKLAYLVGYERLGQPVLRMKPKKRKKKKPRTDAQKAVNLRFKIVNLFISAINDFTNVGFKLDVAGTTKTAQNGASSYNIREAVIGEYPHLELDYTKVMISKGELPCPINPKVELENNVLTFKWHVDPLCGYPLNRDQVMMLAYLPANNTVRFVLSGARRNAGTDTLLVHLEKGDSEQSKKDDVIETYIAFISDDRLSISNSVYVGRIEVGNFKNIKMIEKFLTTN
ncbi:DUF6266 family protein [Pedobacter panaciterrae]